MSNYSEFDPSKDEIIRQWAARLGLDADSPYVIGTAEIELIRRELLNQLTQVSEKIEESDRAWRATATAMSDTVSRALALISTQQDNQNSLSSNCVNLTSALQDLKPMLQALPQSTSKSAPSPNDSNKTLVSKDIASIKSEIESIKTKYDELLNATKRLATAATEKSIEAGKSNSKAIRLGKTTGWVLLVWVLAQILLLICVNSAVRPNFVKFAGQIDQVNKNVNTAISQLNKQKAEIDQLQQQFR